MIDNEDDEERVIGNKNSIEHLSMGFDLNPHHSSSNTPRPSINFKKQLYHFPSSLVDSPVAAVAAEEEEERSTGQSMMVWDLNTPDRVSDRYRLISILGLFYGERTLSAVVKGLPPSLVNYAIDIVVFLLRYIYDEDDDDGDDDDAPVLIFVYIVISIFLSILVPMFMSVCIL